MATLKQASKVSQATGLTTPTDTPVATAADAPPSDSTVTVKTCTREELMANMKSSLITMGQSLQALNENSAKVSTLGPTMKGAAAEIQQLHDRVKAQEEKEDKIVKAAKDMIQKKVKGQVANEIQDHIREQIKLEIALQVKGQINDQISSLFPITLRQQMDEAQKQIVDTKHALDNSKARQANSLLRSSNLDDRLAAILKPDGTRSDVWPVDLRSLFNYDSLMVRVLLRDYGLFAQDTREGNLNRFMAHVGVPFQLVAVPITYEPGSTLTSPIELLRTA